MKIVIAAGMAVLSLVAIPADAKEILGMGTPNAQQFRAKATSSDAFEITSSKIALSHATNADVKEFAQMMIDDHTKSTNKLVAFGGIRKASLIAKMQPRKDGKFAGNTLIDSSHAAELNSLNSKSNADFDKTYMDDQVSGHKDAVSLMQDYGKSGDNAKLKAFANEVLPTIQMHLAKAQKIQSEVEK